MPRRKPEPPIINFEGIDGVVKRCPDCNQIVLIRDPSHLCQPRDEHAERLRLRRARYARKQREKFHKLPSGKSKQNRARIPESFLDRRASAQSSTRSDPDL